MKRKVFVSILLLAIVVSAFCGQAFAEDPPTYTVRLFEGNSDVGDVSGVGAPGKNPVMGTVQYGNTYTFDIAKVVVKDDRYYVKGFRETGKDNSDYIYTGATLPIDRDMDYVVAYGMKGSAVQYTVNFLDSNGEKLADSRVFYGNVGDSPVVSYIYIEGYQPQAYALTMKLKADPALNVFTFNYSEIEPVTVTTTVVGGGGGGGVLPVGGNAGAGAAQPAAPAQPETIIDLDVPLAAPDEATTEPGPEAPEPTAEPEPTVEPTAEPEPEPPKDTKLASWIPYVLGIGGVALLGAFLAALNRRKKKGEALTHADMEDALKEAKKEVNESKDKK